MTTANLFIRKQRRGDVLAADGYSMAVDMKPGDYHLITWAGLSNEASFSVPLITQGVSSLEELQCKMDRIYSRAADGSAVVSSKLSSLWHGEVTKLVVHSCGNPASGDCSFGEKHQYHPRYPPANGRGNGRCR